MRARRALEQMRPLVAELSNACNQNTGIIRIKT